MNLVAIYSRYIQTGHGLLLIVVGEDKQTKKRIAKATMVAGQSEDSIIYTLNFGAEIPYYVVASLYKELKDEKDNRSTE